MNTQTEGFKTLSRTIVRNRARFRFGTTEHMLRAAYILALLIGDLLMLGVAYRLAYWVRFGLELTTAPEVVPSMEYYFRLATALGFGCVLLFALAGLYNWHNLVSGTTEYARSFNACTTTMMLIVVATFMFPNLIISRAWIIASWFISCFMVILFRFSLMRAVYYFRTKGYFRIRALVAGANGESLALAHELQHPRTGYHVLGVFEISRPDRPSSPAPPAVSSPTTGEVYPALPMLGSLDDMEKFVTSLGITELVVSATSMHREELFMLYERVHEIEGLELRLSTGLFEILTTGVQVRAAGTVPLIALKKMRLGMMELIVKTGVEYVLTVIGLILLSPFLAMIAWAIKRDSPGSVIYRRRVVGVGGREYDAFKFRTMRTDGDKILEQYPELAAQLKSEEKLKDDPRITKIGHWLRKYSLDELPQLFNVLLGQMSLVGPRMISPREAEKYGRNRFNLMSVKPGITGLWQVSGRSDLTYEERIKTDMYYVRNYNIWLDFHILFIKTADAVLRSRGAY